MFNASQASFAADLIGLFVTGSVLISINKDLLTTSFLIKLKIGHFGASNYLNFVCVNRSVWSKKPKTYSFVISTSFYRSLTNIDEKTTGTHAGIQPPSQTLQNA